MRNESVPKWTFLSGLSYFLFYIKAATKKKYYIFVKCLVKKPSGCCQENHLLARIVPKHSSDALKINLF